MVSDNRFLQEEPAPSPEALRTALGDKMLWYEGLLAAAPDFEPEWRFHGKKYGWKLKVHDGAKALFEMTVTDDGFRVSIAAREGELEELRGRPSTAACLSAFPPAGKEGWGLRIEVTDEEAFHKALLLVQAIAELRLAE
jgi:Protein of unknown function (DUF3788)